MVSKTNKTTLDTTTYTYNSEDQLIGVITPTQIIGYKYDALGRRIEKNVGSTITRYIYDGENIIQELDGNNTLVTSYIHGPSIDEPIALDKAGQRYYYISDGLGSITAIVDQNGNIAQTYRYDSFGNIINSSGTLTQPFTYTGREYDSETGLYYFRARYYDAHSGRFLQQDPIFDENLYSYCVNNPLNLIDPLGLHAGVVYVPRNSNLRAYLKAASCTFNSMFDIDWDKLGFGKAYWDEFEKRRVPGAQIFGLPTSLFGAGSSTGIYYGTKFAQNAASNMATKSFESVNLGKYGIYVKGYNPAWFTVSKSIGVVSLGVTVFYLSADITTMIDTRISMSSERK